MKDNSEKTTCLKCSQKFSISDNRAHRIEGRCAPFWFFDAIRQFENFNKVQCPSCGCKYKTKEAKLFFFFKSSYTVLIICLLFVVCAIFIVFKLKGN